MDKRIEIPNTSPDVETFKNMASISTFPIFHSISRPATANPTPFPVFRSSISLHTSTNFAASAASFRHSAVYGHRQPRGLKNRRAVEGEASVPEQEVEGEEPPAVTVSVSPSDMLTMFFQVYTLFFFFFFFFLCVCVCVCVYLRVLLKIASAC